MSDDSLVGQEIAGRFRIVSRIGEGSVGEVYLAEHALLSRRFAIKVLKRSFLRHPTVVERFRREALVASRLDHPNVVEISDFGKTEGGRLFLVMEYVEGPTLAWAVESALPLVIPLRRSLRILTQIASALALAHDSGIIHRDLKPENVMLTQGVGGEQAKILDFGLAKIMVSDEPMVLTRRGQMFGTPMYMSPEQARGEELDSRTDIYAFGALAFEVLTGRPLFLTEALHELLVKTQTEVPPTPSAVQPLGTAPIPPELDEVVLACVEKDRDARPLRMSEVATVLRRVRESLRRGGGGYVQTLEYDRLDLAELAALEAEARKRREASQGGAGSASRGSAGGSGEEGEEAFPRTLSGSMRVTTIVELDPYYWRRICSAAVRLALYLRSVERLPVEAAGLLGSLTASESSVAQVEQELDSLGAQLAEVDQDVREREGQLRHAVIDLSLERSRVAEDALADPHRLPDIDAQIEALEVRLAEEHRAGRRRRSELTPRLRELEERVEQMRQAQLDVELSLLDALRAHRPADDVLSPEERSAFEALEQLLQDTA